MNRGRVTGKPEVGNQLRLKHRCHGSGRTNSPTVSIPAAKSHEPRLTTTVCSSLNFRRWIFQGAMIRRRLT